MNDVPDHEATMRFLLFIRVCGTEKYIASGPQGSFSHQTYSIIIFNSIMYIYYYYYNIVLFSFAIMS